MFAINSEYVLKEWAVVAQWHRVVEGSIFSPPAQTGPGAHPAYKTIGTISYPGVKQPGCTVDNLPHIAPRLWKD